MKNADEEPAKAPTPPPRPRRPFRESWKPEPGTGGADHEKPPPPPEKK